MSSVLSFQALYLSLATGIGALQSFHLFFSRRKNFFANRILGIFLISILYVNMLNWLWLTGLMSQVPILFRSGRPLSYIFAPLIYIYLRASIYKEKHFRRYDWIFLIPVILVFMELIPFFLSPTSYKIQSIIKAFSYGIDQQEGMLVGKYHGLLFIFFDLLVSYQIFLMIKNFKKEEKVISIEEQRIIKWITHLMIISIFVLVVFLLFWLINIDRKIILSFYFTQNASIVYFVSAYLLIQPSILDGTYSEVVINKPNLKKSTILSPTKIEQYESIISKLITENKVFLQQRLSLKQLSEMSGISIHHLSAFINRKYSMSFSDFINKLRIDYVVQHLDSAEWKKFTLEGMAKEAGFKSRTAFFSAFKKNMKVTPSDYIKKCRSLKHN